MRYEDFFKAAKEGDLAALQRYVGFDGIDINKQDDLDYTALAYAVENQHVDCVRLLLAQAGIKTDIEVFNSADGIDGIPLHLAIDRRNFEIVQLLVKKSPKDMEVHDYHGLTALHSAVVAKEDEMFKWLLRRGAAQRKSPMQAILWMLVFLVVPRFLAV